MRTVLMASLALGVIAGTALAEDAQAPALAEHTSAGGALATAGEPVAGKKRGRRARANRVAVAQKTEPARSGSSVTDVVASCLAMWDPATHMSRSEWARACRRVAERIKDGRTN
jgi:hypothetical protein